MDGGSRFFQYISKFLKFTPDYTVIHPPKTVLFEVITCDDCTNKVYLETVLGKKVETIKNSLEGHYGMHLTDKPATGSPLHRTPCDNAGITLMLQP